MKKKLCVLFAFILAISMITGCAKGGEPANTETAPVQILEVNQNDYRGAMMRVEAIKGKVMSVVESFNERNQAIVDGQPSNYWSSDNYLYFTSNFIDDTLYLQTVYLNELQTDWATVDEYTRKQFIDANGNATVENLEILRNTVNDYSINYKTYKKFDFIESVYAPYTIIGINCLYDGNHDWAKIITNNKIEGVTVPVTDAFFEYGRVGNSFIIQTQNERLFITYQSTDGSLENENNPLQNGEVKSFYYAKLAGDKRLPQYEIEDVDKEAVMGSMTVTSEFLSSSGEVCNQYNPVDSIFNHIEDITPEWVTDLTWEQGYYSQFMIYENGELTIWNMNKLSNEIETICFHADGTQDGYSTDVEEIPVPEVPETTESTSETSSETPSENVTQ